LAALYDLVERVDALARSVEALTLPDDAHPTPRTAAAIAAHLADTSRALAGMASGWRLHLPDQYAQHAARRLSTELCLSLVQLAAIERRKGIPDDQ
jgi:hypothetical protein